MMVPRETEALGYETGRPPGVDGNPAELHGAASGQRGMNHHQRLSQGAVQLARRPSARWLPTTATVYHVHLTLPERRGRASDLLPPR